MLGYPGEGGLTVQTEEETVTGSGLEDTCPCGDRETFLEIHKGIVARLSLQRLDLLRRTLKVRGLIGKVSKDVAELVHEMREQGGA